MAQNKLSVNCQILDLQRSIKIMCYQSFKPDLPCQSAYIVYPLKVFDRA